MEVGAVKKETLNTNGNVVCTQTLDLPEEPVRVWRPVVRVQTVSREMRIQYESVDLWAP
jgi:hypothetical protein